MAGVEVASHAPEALVTGILALPPPLAATPCLVAMVPAVVAPLAIVIVVDIDVGWDDGCDCVVGGGCDHRLTTTEEVLDAVAAAVVVPMGCLMDEDGWV